MGERIGSIKNPEYPVIKAYVEQALIEERDEKPLSKWHKRSAGLAARYIAIFSSLKPSEQRGEVVELDKVVLRARGSLRYSVWVEKKAKELLPGWMEIRQIVGMSQHDETDVAEQERRGLEKYLAGIEKDNL